MVAQSIEEIKALIEWSATPKQFVKPDEFISRMTEQWQNEYKNEVSLEIQTCWKQLVDSFNEVASFPLLSGRHVLCPPTGIGKTKGLALYCSMLPSSVRVLIIVRLKIDADNLAKSINSLSNKPIAIANHTDTNHSREQITTSPILIVTHQAYLSEQPGALTEERSLSVIDESIELFSHFAVHLDDLKLLLAIIPYSKRTELSEDIEVLQKVIAWLEQQADGKLSTTLRQKADWELPSEPLVKLKGQLKTILNNRNQFFQADREFKTQLHTHFSDLLNNLIMVLSEWSLYATKGNEHYLATSRLIMEELPKAIVLDATAELNQIYNYMPNIKILPPPINARNYANVTLHVSLGHKVGKGGSKEVLEQQAAELIDNLKQILGKKRKLLVCTHKISRRYLEKFKKAFTSYDVAHWNAIDGRNDWHEYDAIAILSLPYTDSIYPACNIEALRLATTPRPLTEAEKETQRIRWEEFKKQEEEEETLRAASNDTEAEKAVPVLHEDEDFSSIPAKLKLEETGYSAEDLRIDSICVSVVQAINRIHCRHSIDAKGNCPPTDVFLLLPQQEAAKRIKDAIHKAMPNIREIEWDIDIAKRKAKGSKAVHKLLAYLAALPKGRYKAQDIRELLSIRPDTWKNFTPEFAIKSSPEYAQLKTLGFSYYSGKGRSGAFFVKE